MGDRPQRPHLPRHPARGLGYLTRRIGERAKGRTWYETRLIPRIGPFALYGLLFTIVVLFALQGGAITSQPFDVARIALPLLVYFVLMWAGSMLLGKAVGLDHPRTTTLAFTAAGNNFELAIAVAIAAFGATSGQALAGVVGPLIEVPVLIGLVHVALYARRYFTPHRPHEFRTAGGAHPCLTLRSARRCCSSASTTPGVRRWRPPSSPTSPVTASTSGPPGPHRRTR